MADFVAVIRRAVDGLSDNTPELRAKVYEKARGAVLRQLESMKPRPPEEMLRRQLDKLESAIVEVESEHAEALPAIEDAEILTPEIIEPEAPAPGPVVPEPEQPVAALEPVHEAPVAVVQEPEAAEPVALEPHVPEPVAPAAPAPDRAYLWGDESWAGEEKPVAPEPTAYAPSYALPEAEAPEPEPEPEAAYSAPVHVEPEAESEPVAAATAPVEPIAVDDDVYPGFPVEEPTAKYSQMVDVHPAAGYTAAEPFAHEPVSDAAWPDGGVETTATAVVEPEAWTATASLDESATAQQGDFPPGMETDRVDDPFSWESAQQRADVVELASQPAQVVHADLVAPQQDSFDEPVLHAGVHAEPDVEVLDPEPVQNAEPAAEWVQVRSETDTSDAPEVVVPEVEPTGFAAASAKPATKVDDWDESPFTDVPLPNERGDGTGKSSNRDWEEFEDFKSFDEAGEQAAKEEVSDEFLFTPVEKPARSYRIQPRRRVDFTSIGLGLLGLLLVAGSGYGAWVFRDTLSGLVTGLVSSPPSTDGKGGTTPSTTTPATTAPASTTTPAASTTSTDANKAPTPEPAEAELQKFTQRLKADGSEVDEGKPTGGSGEGEGKSVAPQTVASNTPAETSAPATGTNQPATPAAIPVGVAQKMFLYEERVGQTSPVAIEGSVVWSLKHELADNGKNEAIVTGMVTAPDRGLSAQITVKRNLDPSLPASHLVEMVFSLPKDFDGGAIDSVQRVSMKQTEQDRGDPLIAVPAKITDDFHMIALNDYSDARAFNLKLLQTRNWIDIPLTYRNGRRALLTMEKGTTGMEAFSQAIREWQAEDGAAVPAASTPSTPTAPTQTAPVPAAQVPAANP